MDLLEDTGLLLDLLREAGDEAVTLDELEVVGVRDPARALLQLELAGHAVSRVVDATHPRQVPCVRLAPAPAPAAPVPAADHRLLAAGVLGLLLVLLVALGRRR
jgi:hypothetical protein